MNQKTIISIIFLFIFFVSNAQQDAYQKASLNISIPVNLKTEKRTLRFDTGNVTKEEKEETSYIQINLNIDDMRLNGNQFSGIKITSFPVTDEIVTFSGNFSSDKKSIESIIIDYEFIQYSIADRSKAHLEEKKTAHLVLKNVPKYMSSYTFKYETSEIKSAKLQKYKYLKYRAISETTISSGTLNEEGVNKYTQCLSLRLSPSSHTGKSDRLTKVGILTNGCKRAEDKTIDCSPVKGIFSSLSQKLNKIPGLKVLERERLGDILNEQELSSGGLVSEDMKIESGKIIEEELLVIVQLSETILDEDGAAEGWQIKTLMVEKETGNVIDSGLSIKLTKDQMMFDHYVMSVYSYLLKEYFK